MNDFMRSARAAHRSARSGDITFTSQDEALAFFEEHWDHGATNEGLIGVTVECSHCNQAWDFTGSMGMRPSRTPSRRLSDGDRDFF